MFYATRWWRAAIHVYIQRIADKYESGEKEREREIAHSQRGEHGEGIAFLPFFPFLRRYILKSGARTRETWGVERVEW